MQTQIIAALISAVAVLLAPLMQNRFKVDPRLSIERDLKIAEQLPVDSEARKTLEHDIERRVRELPRRMNGTRYWTGVIMGSLFAGGCLYGVSVFAKWGWTGSGWAKLWLAPALLLLLCAFAFVVQLPKDFEKLPRDSKGKVIPEDESPTKNR